MGKPLHVLVGMRSETSIAKHVEDSFAIEWKRENGRVFRHVSTDAPIPADADALVVTGGDGFLLEVIRRHRVRIPILGWNAGQIGFHMNELPIWGILQCLAEIAAGEHATEVYHLVDAELTYDDARIECIHAFNEVSLERLGQQTVRLGVAIDGASIGQVTGDGLCIASAQGTTGYGVSMAGPAVDPLVPSLTLIPNNPHRARRFPQLLFPMVLAPTRVITVEVHESEKRPVRIVADGTEYRDVVAVHVSTDVGRADAQPIRLIRLGDARKQFPSRIHEKFIGDGAEDK